MKLFVPFTVTSLFALVLSAVAAFKFSQSKLQNILQQLFAAFQGFRAIESLPVDDWWSRAEALGGQLKLWTDQELANVAKTAGDHVDALKARVSDVASSANRISEHVSQGKKQEVYDELNKTLETILTQMRKSFPSPEKARSHNERKELVHRALEIAEEKIVGILKDRTSIDEDELRRDVRGMCSAVENLVVLGGDTFEQWPILTKILLMLLSMLLRALIPEWFILQPLLRFFGFGPLGPIKGSAAAWAQRAFWGAAVTKGSWFAELQQAGMTGTRVEWVSRLLSALFGGVVTSGSTWFLRWMRRSQQR